MLQKQNPESCKWKFHSIAKNPLQALTITDILVSDYKQIIERLNRTFKFSYQVTNGYGSGEGSNTHVALFVAYYNFLRPHSYTYWEPLNSIPELESIPNMPAKWQKLIELSQQLILSKQVVSPL